MNEKRCLVVVLLPRHYNRPRHQGMSGIIRFKRHLLMDFIQTENVGIGNTKFGNPAK